ncbi:hypothetical protein IU428_07390 [Nocardia abscessus]|uniref:hypothetical protein n=1 Tax=Nocardia abscessus TaxID=120957 RepID=UPI0018955A84|nr:hypothetical protein [Nocardia abscessus]MBF6471652.1 hypothetical protein [Nocardia abscessus]
MGLLAVAVASYWNYRTYKRVDERYENDLREAHADNVRQAVVEVIHQTTLWARAAEDYRALVQREFDTPPSNQAEASEAEKRMRAAAHQHSLAHMDLRRALWSAQLIVDEPVLHEAILETITLQKQLLNRKVSDWSEMPARIKELNELRIQTNDKVDGILEYALANLSKRSPDTDTDH